MLFQGEEWGASSPFQYFVDFAEEPELATAVSVGRRKEFEHFNWTAHEVPDPQCESTFLNSKLPWHELSDEGHRELHQWYQELIALRRRIPSLVDGRLDQIDVKHDARAGWLLMTRGEFLAAFNFAEHPCRLSLQGHQGSEVFAASATGILMIDSKLILPGHAVAVIGVTEATELAEVPAC